MTQIHSIKSQQELSSFTTEWSPKEYLNEFYTDDIDADEREALKFQINYAKEHLTNKPLALDFGSGPTALRALAIAPYVSEIHIAEYLQGNIEELKKWVYNQPDGHDWDLFVEYILQCEGIKKPTDEQIEQRKALTRGKITKFFQADAGDKYPLGKEYDGYYQHVYSGFCADSATNDKAVWKLYMHNIASLIASNGSFFTAALRNTTSYAAGTHTFPSANINENDMRNILELDFLPQSITIEIRDLPEMKEHGFEGIILAHAIKK
ncbi:MAG TPA: guanitoxin biosynthesis pre-guanitoxin forming N-methyltransferase GntF [Candidatus Saccharimonadales bacterium]|nr:guanitoxin biosynthesis pre-guanitoxin forming N-methyltransferase GntF [Candidatus Saccharimonadales bacterium]